MRAADERDRVENSEHTTSVKHVGTMKPPSDSRHSKGPTASLATIVNATLLIVSVGFLLVIGKSVLLPILSATIAVYILVSASEGLAKVPVLARFPAGARRFIVLLGFTAAVITLMGVVFSTVSSIIVEAPGYQANIAKLVDQATDFLGIEERPDWQTLRDATLKRLSIEALLNTVFVNITGIGATVFLIIVYSAFLLTERAAFASKLAVAVQNPDTAERAQDMIRDINERIGDYLAVKTLINVILGAISFIILWGLDVDFPLFWALTIGLLNYIPYFGSLVGVVLPVGLSIVQFGDLKWTLLLAALLVGAQMWVGNVLEPRMIGRRVNLSPFFVLVALAVWSALWGLPGALLAVPLTSMLTIVLSAFEPTRPIAVLMANSVTAADAPTPDLEKRERHDA